MIINNNINVVEASDEEPVITTIKTKIILSPMLSEEFRILYVFLKVKNFAIYEFTFESFCAQALNKKGNSVIKKQSKFRKETDKFCQIEYRNNVPKSPIKSITLLEDEIMNFVSQPLKTVHKDPYRELRVEGKPLDKKGINNPQPEFFNDMNMDGELHQ